jgi:hypothetical protein
MWGVSTTPVLSHYLEGRTVNKSNLENASSSSRYIIVLDRNPNHAVVFTQRYTSNLYGYYDPQNSTTGYCMPNEIKYTYMATGYNHY